MKTTTRIHASPVSDKNGQRPDTPAGFPARLASRWLDGLIAERGLSRNTVAAYRQDLDALRDFLDELETPLSGLDDENITLFIAWLRKRAAHFVPAQFPRMVRRTGGTGLQPGRPHRHAQAPFPPARRADAR